MSERFVILSALVALGSGAGCTDPSGPGSFAGRWEGANATFSRVVFELTPTADSVRGSVLFTFAAGGSAGGPGLAVAVRNDSLAFTLPMAPSTGYCGIDFAGRRTGREIRGTTLTLNSTGGGWGSTGTPGCEPASVPDPIVLRRP